VSPSSGSGGGTASFTVPVNSGPARTGTLTVAGQTYTVNQSDGCSLSISPTNSNMTSLGGPGTTTVSGALGCTWTAASNATWITNVLPTSGNGGGAVAFTVQANTGPQRTGTLTVANQTFTVTQATGCTFSINPTSANVPNGGGSRSTNVTAGTGCTWTAVSNVSWITNVSPSSGSGNGSVNFTVQSNPAGSRTGTLTIAGQTFTVNQSN